MEAISEAGGVEGSDEARLPTPGGAVAIQIRLMAIASLARFHGVDLDRNDLRLQADVVPSPGALAKWLRDGGLWAKPVRLSWKQLLGLDLAAPVVLLLTDGSAVLLVANDAKRDQVWVRHSRLAKADPPVALTEKELLEAWAGEAVLIRAKRTAAAQDAPFSLGWVAELVWMERHVLRDVGLASLVLSILTVLPALMVMTVIDQVVTHQSLSTLVLMSLLIGVAMLSETLLGYARRQLILIVGARVDAKLNLHVFERLLRLPLDYFERNQARYDLVDDRLADQQDPGVSEREAADDDAGSGHAGGVAADPVRAAACAVLDGAAGGWGDRGDHQLHSCGR